MDDLSAKERLDRYATLMNSDDAYDIPYDQLTKQWKTMAEAIKRWLTGLDERLNSDET